MLTTIVESGTEELQDGVAAAVTANLAFAVTIGVIAFFADPYGGPPTARRAAWYAKPGPAGLLYGVIYALLFGEFTGLVYGLAIALAVELSARLTSQDAPATGVRWAPRGLPTGALAGYFAWTFALITDATRAAAPTIGLAVGCISTLVLGLDAPSRITAVQSPPRSLARDRTAFLSLAFGTSLVFALALAIMDGSFRHVEVPLAILGALTYGAGLGVIIAAGKASWARYSLARVLLALTGRLPWRCTAFMVQAHHRGVLRQNGATYQFRHIDLQHSLARAYEAEPPSPPGWLSLLVSSRHRK